MAATAHDHHDHHDHVEVPASEFRAGDIVQPAYYAPGMWEVVEIAGTDDLDDVRCVRLSDGSEAVVQFYRIAHGLCLRCCT